MFTKKASDTKDANGIDIKLSLVEKGLYVDHKFLQDNDIQTLFPYFLLRESRPGVVEFNREKILKEKGQYLFQLFSSIENVMKVINPRLDFHKLWFQTTTKESVQSFEAKASPFLPHIDTQRYTKAMVYLTDVGTDDGPFTSSKLSPNNFENLRKKIHQKDPAWMDYQISQKEFSMTQNTYDPILGERGMLIVFDTNTPHFAGKITSNQPRKVLRFDFWDKNFILN